MIESFRTTKGRVAIVTNAGRNAMDVEDIGHDFKVTGVGEPYLERSLQAVTRRGDGR